jgi:hypothetical protein
VPDDVSYRIAYEEAVRALRAQADTFAGIRQRASTVLATTMVVTAFFGGQAVVRGTSPGRTGWLAVVAFVAAGLLSVFVLFPSDPPFDTDTDAVVALVEDAPPGSDPLRELVLMLSTRHGGNRGRIARLEWIFRGAATAMLVEVLLWIAFLAET